MATATYGASYGTTGAYNVAPGLVTQPAAVTTAAVAASALPAMTTMAATTGTMAVPAVAAMPAVAATPYAAMPMQPMRLTEGLPDPSQIASQKAAYAKALDAQLKQALETIQQENAIEKEMLKFKAEKDAAMYQISVDQWATEQAALVDEQTTFQQLELKKAAVERKLQLDSQASNLIMDYSMRQAQEEMMKKHYAFQQQYASTAVAAAATAPYPMTAATPGVPMYPAGAMAAQAAAQTTPAAASTTLSATHGKPQHHGMSGHI